MILYFCIAVALLTFAIVLWMRVRRAGDHDLTVLLAEAQDHLDLAANASTLVLHKAWFSELRNDARARTPLRSGFALGAWIRCLRNGLTMAKGTAAEKHVMAALFAAGEIRDHARAPKGIA